jgi:hypothetical protein
MDRKTAAESELNQANPQDEDGSQSNATMNRRKALAKIGKFSAYAAPASYCDLE